MRGSAIEDCRLVLEHHQIDTSRGQAIDVGGTERVYLEGEFVTNPLKRFHPDLAFLDRGFNIEAIGTHADEVVDFLDPGAIEHLRGRFDMVLSFDTLEHVSDPFTFCRHLIEITRPGGHVYAATVFEWAYHPSPQDYFRFSPTGLAELFTGPCNPLASEFEVLWHGWGSDRRGVSLLGRRLGPDETAGSRTSVAVGSIEELPNAPRPDLSRRWARFRRKPRSQKLAAIRRLLLRPLVLPVRLASGAWMITWPDAFGWSLRQGTFEPGEQRFVHAFLGPGMTFLDIGAHNGAYSLTAAKAVAPGGRVVAFEPSPRERRRLRWNIRLNRLRNITLESLAVGETPGQASLFVVDGLETGFNSLRRPQDAGSTREVPVTVVRLDDYLDDRPAAPCDLLKMDVEGGELGVLRGAQGLLERRPRPVILCEVADDRTTRWGYRASEILDFLRKRGYSWFGVGLDGRLVEMTAGQGNFVAVPEERLRQVGSLLASPPATPPRGATD